MLRGDRSRCVAPHREIIRRGVQAMLSLLKTGKNITAFARSLAEGLAKRYPPALDINPEKKISANRLTKVLEEALSSAAQFQRDNRLGLYGKAKLGNEFKWQLKELGYSEQFIEIATEGLMVYITRGNEPAAPASQPKA
jgi:hypothetical protein